MYRLDLLKLVLFLFWFLAAALDFSECIQVDLRVIKQTLFWLLYFNSFLFNFFRDKSALITLGQHVVIVRKRIVALVNN